MELLELFRNAKSAVRDIDALSEEKVNEILKKIADALENNTVIILKANKTDLSKFDPSDYRYDRLKLTEDRIAAIASDMRNVAKLPSPRRTLEERTLSNGLKLKKEAVPFGVIGVIFESRPNVSADVFSLCFKSGNVCLLKGGHDAEESNKAIVGIIKEVLISNGINQNAVTLLPSTRKATEELLQARGFVDMIIPRGSQNLINYVRENARVPVIETGAGVCHCYIHTEADLDMAQGIVLNAKTRRVSVCNALDCLIIDRDVLDKLEKICLPLASKKVRIYADADSYEVLRMNYPNELLYKADDKTFGTEFLDYAMAVKTVAGLDEAIRHIDLYGSGHSECIVTQNRTTAEKFQKQIDAACVYHNVPTSFTDGAQFGLGAEIGISTQKLHARGPMALAELMTYKWLISGNGQLRP